MEDPDCLHGLQRFRKNQDAGRERISSQPCGWGAALRRAHKWSKSGHCPGESAPPAAARKKTLAAAAAHFHFPLAARGAAGAVAQKAAFHSVWLIADCVERSAAVVRRKIRTAFGEVTDRLS